MTDCQCGSSRRHSLRIRRDSLMHLCYFRRVTQDLNVSPIYDAVFWNPPQKYVFKNKRPPAPKAVKVYEAHGE